MLPAIIIPARAGSKGFPHKNRFLFEYTAKTIPPSMYSNVVVTTDDPVIKSKAETYGFRVHMRAEELASDTADIRSVLNDVVQTHNINGVVAMLYLTYPQRTWEHVQQALSFFDEHKASSMLCRKELSVHPYLCLKKVGEHQGSQLVPHDLYRRQEYPECFEISHFMAILKTEELEKVNKNLYNKDTIFYNIDQLVIDVDTEEDFKKFYG